jgi:hypothetical protein
MEFTDTDGVRVYMKRIIHTNGTAEFTTTKDGRTSVELYPIMIIMYSIL